MFIWGPPGEIAVDAALLAPLRGRGFPIRLCRPYRAKTKGKVESDDPWVRERLLRAHSFRRLRAGQHAWSDWNADVARARVHGTHGEVVAVGAQRDRAALLAAPPAPYLVTERAMRTVARDAVPVARPGERVELVRSRRACTLLI